MLFMSRMVSMSFGVHFYRSRLLRQGKMLFLGKVDDLMLQHRTHDLKLFVIL